MGKQHYIIPVFVPDLGCPHQCVFCNQKKITGQLSTPTGQEVEAIINRYLQTMSQGPGITREIAFYGGSFTAVEPGLQKELLEPAYRHLIKGDIDTIRISTRPDALSEDIISLLVSYGVGIIELGVQSMDDSVLLQSRRGHNSRDVLRAAALVRSWGVTLGFQVMLGLPGDSGEAAVETAVELTALKPDMVRIYPCLVLKDTPLAEAFEKGEYNPLGLDEAVAVCARLLLIFEKAGIPVIRVGLQPSEQINLEGDVLAGPYHPAFRELVESLIARAQLVYLLRRRAGVNRAESLRLAVPPQDISRVRGHRSSNVDYLNSAFGVTRFYTREDAGLPRNTIRLEEVDGRECLASVDKFEISAD